MGESSEDSKPEDAEPAGGGQAEPSTVPILVHVSEKPGDRIGRYKLLQKLGEGGCGIVYMAEQEEPVKRRVALKVIKLGMDTKEVIARFEAERQALALMDHPNIAKVLDGGATATGRPFFVMELVRGIPITRYCDENRLNTTQRLDLFILVCQAIQHAHQKGIIHRDIKPSNILVADHDGTPVPKVIDFGIAKATAGQTLTDKTLFTAFEQFIGTPAYMSPEQAKLSGLDIDTRSDIYSLGVLLYEMLTGKTPFDAKRLIQAGFDEIRRIIREEEPPRPSTRLTMLAAEEQTDVARRRQTDPPKLAGLVRGDLDWIVMKMLEKDRSRRYETANGVATDLKRFLASEPVMARPPSNAYRLQKLVRRHKLAFAAGTAVVTSLLVGIAVSAWQAIRATRSQHEAERARTAAKSEATRADQNARQAQQQRDLAYQSAYGASMLLAQMDWENNNLGRLRQLLRQTRSYPERGFEWYYWQRQTHLDLMTLRGHDEGVLSVAYSTDGRLIATGGDDQTVRIWDAATGKELQRLAAKRGSVNCVAFSLDSTRIVAGTESRIAKVWQITGGKELLTLKGHKGPIEAVAYSPDGKCIVTGSADETAKAWDADTGRELATFGYPGTGVYNESARNPVSLLAFSPDGRRIATGRRPQIPRIWEVSTGKELLALNDSSPRTQALRFSADGLQLIGIDQAGTISVWDSASGRRLPGSNLKGASLNLWYPAFSPDGRRLATALGGPLSGADGNPRIWDLATGEELLTCKGHAGMTRSAAFSPDGSRLVTSGDDGTAKVWDARPAKLRSSFKTGTNSDQLVGLSPDCRKVLTRPILLGERRSSAVGPGTVWDVASGRKLFSIQPGAWSGLFSQDGSLLAVGFSDGAIKVLETAAGKELVTLKGYDGMIWAFSPDGRRVVGSGYKSVKVWDVKKGSEVLSLASYKANVRSAAFSPDSKRLATAGDDGTVRVWDAATGSELLTLSRQKREILCVAFSHDGSRLVAGSDTGARVWNAVTGKDLLDLLTIDAGQIWSVVFSADERRVLTVGEGFARLWDAANGTQLLSVTDSGSSHMALAADDRSLVSISDDGTLRVFETATESQVTAWEAEEKIGAENLAAFQREQAAEAERAAAQRQQDDGAIKQWLLLGPFDPTNVLAALDQRRIIGVIQATNPAAVLNQQWLPAEAQLHPRVGESTRVGQSEMSWKETRLSDYVLREGDFPGTGAPSYRGVGYAIAYLHSEVEQDGLVLKIGTYDQAKVYLNGNQVYENLEARYYFPDEDEVREIHLKRGVNVLVLKAIAFGTGWQGSVRLADQDDNPVKGLTVTTTP